MTQEFNYYINHQTFLSDLQLGKITDRSISFIKDISALYTHGNYFYSNLTVTKTSAPTASDYNYSLGTKWVVGDKIYTIIDNTQNAAVWIELVNSEVIGDIQSLLDYILTGEVSTNSVTNDDVEVWEL